MSAAYQFPRATPESAGISSSSIARFVDALQEPARPLDAVHSLMILRHGSVIAEGWWEPYTASANHMMFSVSKSYCSTGVGIAVGEGLFSVEDAVLSFFPDEVPANPSPNLRAMQVKHLLSMNTGHHEDTTSAIFGSTESNWAQVFLSLPVQHEPGSWFVYNTGATYMLSAIITKLSGLSLLDYLQPRLFDPLGIEHPTWDTDPRGINIGGSGLHIRTKDIAHLGQLYLQQGTWNGHQIVSPEWVAEATDVHSDNSNTQTNPDWTVGYGYQFWRCRHNAYRGDGAFGQYCLVLPDQDAVLAITSGLNDMQAVLDKVWDILLPAFEPAPLPADDAAHTALQYQLSNLKLRGPVGRATSSQADALEGRTWQLAPNQFGLTSLTFSFRDGETVLRITGSAGENEIVTSPGMWQRGHMHVPDPRTGIVSADDGAGVDIAASGAWPSPTTFNLWIAFVAGVYGYAWRLDIDGDFLRLMIEPNVAWGPITPIILDGQITA